MFEEDSGDRSGVGAWQQGARFIRAGFMAVSRLSFCLLIAGAAAVLAADDARAQSEPKLEHEVKAAFLYHFTQFVTWPVELGREPGSPVVIGVIGSDAFLAALERAVRGKTVKGRSLVVRRLQSGDSLASCHILFISSSEDGRLTEILQRVQELPILTVGETERFARLGGVIHFKLVDNRTRLEINLDAADRVHLKMSAKLLSVATVLRNRGR